MMKLRKLICVAAGLVMVNSFAAFAEYEDIDYFDANLQYDTSLKPKIEAAKEELESLEKQIQAYEEQVEEYQAQADELEEDYEAEIAKEGVKDMNLIVKYKDVKSKLKTAENQLASAKKVYERTEQKIETLETQLSNVTDRSLNYFYGDDSKTDVNVGYLFSLSESNGNWVLSGTYRTWTSLMGGQWQYNSIITDDLDIAFYDGSNCMESNLSRAPEYDTESAIAWIVNGDLESNHKYTLDIYGNKYSLYSAVSSGVNSNDNDSDVNDQPEYSDSSEYSEADNTLNADTSASAALPAVGEYFVKNNFVVNADGAYERQEDNSGVWEKQENNSWKYKKSNGSYAADEIIKINGLYYGFNTDSIMYTNCWLTDGIRKYYCDESGSLVVGWRNVQNKWYYFDTDNMMFRNGITPDGYTVDMDGVWNQ